MFRSILHLSFKIRTKKTQLIVKWLYPSTQQEWKQEIIPAVFQKWLTYFKIIPGEHASKCQTNRTLHCSRVSWWTALKMGDKIDSTLFCLSSLESQKIRNGWTISINSLKSYSRLPGKKSSSLTMFNPWPSFLTNFPCIFILNPTNHIQCDLTKIICQTTSCTTVSF